MKEKVFLEKTDYGRVAAAGLFGLVGIDLIAHSNIVLGILSLALGMAVWNNRKVAVAQDFWN